MSDQIALSSPEQAKLAVLKQLMEHAITNKQASRMLNLSVRHVQRLKQQIRILGDIAVIHKLKGKESNNSIRKEIKEKSMQIIKDNYDDYKPGFATEKLEEIHGIVLSSETIRKWMREAGLWKAGKRRRNDQYRSWRPRKEYFGELMQFDGSYHYWLEERFADKDGVPIEVCLLAAIDDATGKITKASFSANEGVIAVFTFWKEYIEEVGRPLFVYLDKFSTYKINHKNAVDNKELMTQFQRGMNDLLINLIPANSPQAKGRIERLFKTLQDRLIKEMRLSKINSPDEGNRFLEEVFISKFNNRFAVIPAKEGDIHRNLSEIDRRNLNRIFSIQSIRKVNNDFTVQFKNKWYQLLEIQPTTVRAKDRVLIEEWINGTIHLSLREKYLKYIVLLKRPEKIGKQPLILTTHRLNYKPPSNHPWRLQVKAALQRKLLGG